jgi:hypothetical protein
LTVAGAVILAPFVGPTAGASIGAGIGGLIQGESFEEAMGSALTAGATATIGSGIAGMFGGGGFMQGVEQGFSKVGTQGFGFDTIKDNFGEVFSMDRFGADTKTGSGFQDTLQKGKELLTGKAPTAESLGAAKSTAYDTAYKTVLDKTKEEALAKAAGTKAMEGITMKSLQPSLLRKYGPSVALAATAGGFFDKPPQEEFEDPDTGQDLIDADPNKYLVQNTQIQGTTPPYMVPTQFPFMPQPSPPVTFAAKGGDVFPRRNGGIGPEEGTPGEDSVRAMLMPGEFVMTTNAVKGAGGGDLNRGINNMYSMMRNFEAKARA